MQLIAQTVDLGAGIAFGYLVALGLNEGRKFLVRTWKEITR